MPKTVKKTTKRKSTTKEEKKQTVSQALKISEEREELLRSTVFEIFDAEGSRFSDALTLTAKICNVKEANELLYIGFLVGTRVGQNNVIEQIMTVKELSGIAKLLGIK